MTDWLPLTGWLIEGFSMSGKFSLLLLNPHTGGHYFTVYGLDTVEEDQHPNSFVFLTIFGFYSVAKMLVCQFAN